MVQEDSYHGTMAAQISRWKMDQSLTAGQVDVYLSQLPNSSQTLVEDLAIKTYELDDSKRNFEIEVKAREQCEEEIKYLHSVISTLQLSVEKYNVSSADLQEENTALKLRVLFFSIASTKQTTLK